KPARLGRRCSRGCRAARAGPCVPAILRRALRSWSSSSSRPTDMEATRPVLEPHPQDLLFRSAETPFAAAFEAGGARILVRTNDPELFSALPTPEMAPAERCAFLWKLVRDNHCFSEAEALLIVSAEEVTMVS